MTPRHSLRYRNSTLNRTNPSPPFAWCPNDIFARRLGKFVAVAVIVAMGPLRRAHDAARRAARHDPPPRAGGTRRGPPWTQKRHLGGHFAQKLPQHATQAVVAGNSAANAIAYPRRQLERIPPHDLGHGRVEQRSVGFVVCTDGRIVAFGGCLCAHKFLPQRRVHYNRDSRKGARKVPPPTLNDRLAPKSPN